MPPTKADTKLPPQCEYPQRRLQPAQPTDTPQLLPCMVSRAESCLSFVRHTEGFNLCQHRSRGKVTPSLLLQIAHELSAYTGTPQFPKGPGFNLAYALAADMELLPHFLKRVWMPVVEAVP